MKIERKCVKTVEESIELAKKEKNAKIGVYGLLGNGFILTFQGKTFGCVIKENLNMYELETAYHEFDEYLFNNGIVPKQGKIKVSNVCILANKNYCTECKQIVSGWSNKKMRQIQKYLDEAKRAILLNDKLTNNQSNY